MPILILIHVNNYIGPCLLGQLIFTLGTKSKLAPEFIWSEIMKRLYFNSHLKTALSQSRWSNCKETWDFQEL